MAWQLVAVGAACGSLGAGFGWVLAMVMVARDPAIHKILPTQAVVDKEVFTRLRLIAQVKAKNPDLKFDADGHLKHQVGEDDFDG
jgi:hypothetical protein